MNLTFEKLAELVPAGTRVVNANSRKISGFSIDSRTARGDEIFVAIKTEKRDGHDFVSAAVAAGVPAVLVERGQKNVPAEVAQIIVPAGKKSEDVLREIAANYRREILKTVPVIGVTGSVGKTSTKDMLACLLAGAKKVFATPKNLNNTLGVPLNICRIDPQKHEIAVIEMGTNAPGEIAVSAAAAMPDLAVITNVLPVHLEGLGSLEGVAAEKASVARDPRCRAVFHRSLLKYAAFEKIASRGNACVVGEDSDLREIVRVLRSPSAGQRENALLALCAAKNFVDDETLLRERLAAWEPSENRGELRLLPDGRRIFADCYNASPFSMIDSVNAFHRALDGVSKSPRLHVLGGMGELGKDSESLHRFTGENLKLDPERDTLALFGGNAFLIGEGAVSAGFPRERVFVFETIDALRGFVAGWRGDLMLKGSRAFALERVLE